MYKIEQIHFGQVVRLSVQDRMGIEYQVLKLQVLNMELDLKNVLLIFDRCPIIYKSEQIHFG